MKTEMKRLYMEGYGEDGAKRGRDMRQEDNETSDQYW